MDTIYKDAKCGARVAGYGQEDLNKNLESHESNCAACKALSGKIQETIINSVNPKETIKETIKESKPKLKKVSKKKAKKKLFGRKK